MFFIVGKMTHRWNAIRLLSVVLLACFSLFFIYNTILPVYGHVASNNNSCDAKTEMSTRNVSDERLDPNEISFLNWNIYKGQGEDWQQDLTQFAQNHQLMTIQEALLDDTLTELLHSHDVNWTMHRAFYLKDVSAGVINVASTEALQSCGFRVNEPLIRVPKSALVSYYAIEGSEEKLLVANIHSVNFSLGLRSYRKQLTMLYDALADHKGPMIVAGDFNSWSKSRLQEVNDLVVKLSLSKLEHGMTGKTEVFGNAIDHVFYRQLEVLSNEVLRVTSSDHNPISVSFKYLAVPLKTI